MDVYNGSDLDPPCLQFDEHRINGVVSSGYFDSSVDDKGLATDATRFDMMKAKRRLVMFRPVLR